MQTADKALGGLFKACDPQGAYEVELQGLWNRIPLGVNLPLSGGGSFEVVSRGTWNVEAGPDFLNAKLRIDGAPLRGDVEIHRKASDWLRHGHQHDKAYAKVMLHVVESDDRNGKTAPELPTYELGTGKTCAPAPDTSQRGRCARHLSSLPAESLRKAFSDAGLERLRAKSGEALELMIASGETQAYLSKLFDAAGFKVNREAFAETLKRYLSHAEPERAQFREALLWGESGLLPDPSKTALDEDADEKAKALWTAWWPLRGRFAENINWKRSGSRPLNSPERRLAAVCALLGREGECPLPAFEGKLRKETPKAFNKLLVSALSASDPFWDRRTSFTSSPLAHPGAVSGAARAMELAINVAYPCLLAKARLKQDKALEGLTEKAYLALSSAEANRIFKNALARWFVEPDKAAVTLASAAERQGVMHIYATYCDGIASDCDACLLFNSI